MHVRSLEIENVRVLRAAKLSLHDGVNLLVGPNGSGKTSVLECLHFLSTGRSFRVRGVRDVVQRDQECLTIVGELRGNEGEVTTVGVRKGNGLTRMRVGGEEVRSAAVLARLLPLVVVTPDCQRLLSDGSELRRRLVDWLLFHVEPGYMSFYNGYRRALKQRNALLRQGVHASELFPWNERVAESGEALHDLRLQRLEEILPRWSDVLGDMLPLHVSVDYQRGWTDEVSLASCLVDRVDEDRRRGFTGAGPHRADLRFKVAGASAQHVLSRGEAKLFSASILIGQALYFAAATGIRPVILVDDLSSELDVASRERFFDALKRSEAQVVVTTVAEELVLPFIQSSCRMFHVEQGEVEQVL